MTDDQLTAQIEALEAELDELAMLRDWTGQYAKDYQFQADMWSERYENVVAKQTIRANELAELDRERNARRYGTGETNGI